MQVDYIGFVNTTFFGLVFVYCLREPFWRTVIQLMVSSFWECTMGSVCFIVTMGSRSACFLEGALGFVVLLSVQLGFAAGVAGSFDTQNESVVKLDKSTSRQVSLDAGREEATPYRQTQLCCE